MKQFEAKVQNSCFKKEIEYLSITTIINKIRSCFPGTKRKRPYGLAAGTCSKTLSP
jgi:hypothetical protein